MGNVGSFGRRSHGGLGFQGLAYGVLGLLYFLSGFVGLVYQVLWARMLENFIGLAAYAHAGVLAAFIGGMALGAWVLGPLADRWHPLRLYALLEAWVGLYAWVFPHLVEGVRRLILRLLPTYEPNPGTAVGYYVLKLVIPLALLLPATVALGGTYPAVVRVTAPEVRRVGRSAAWLYALNAWGASFGALAAIFVGFPWWGLGGTNRRAASLSLGVASVAAVLALRIRPSATPPAEEPSGVYDARWRPWVLGIVTAAGILSFVLEVAWARYLSVLLGSSISGFALMVSAVIAGLALGSALLHRWDSWLTQRYCHDRALTVALWGVAGSLLGVLWLYERIPVWLARYVQIFRPDPLAYPVYEIGRYLLCFSMVMAPAVFWGMMVPLAVRLAVRRPSTVGWDTGLVYALNSSGNVVGALLGGLVVLPTLGLTGTFQAVALSCSILAVLWGFRTGFWAGVRVGLPAAGVLFAGFIFPGVDLRIYALNASFPQHVTSLEALRQNFRPVFYREDPGGQVLVLERPDGSDRLVYLNGKLEIALRAPYDPASVHIACLLYPQTPKRVLVIGAGVGISAATVFRYPVGHVVGVEIIRALRHLSPLFTPTTNPLLTYRPNYTFVFDDAKSYLHWVAPATFDLVIGQMANPWISSIGNLFTLEQLKRVRQALRPEGMYVQVFYVGDTTDATFLVVARTMRQVFPYVSVFRLGPRVVVFMATLQPLEPDWTAMTLRAHLPAVRESLAFYGFSGPLDLLLLQSHTPSAFDRLLSAGPPGPLNRDDNLWLELRAPRLYFSGEAFRILDATDQRRHGDLTDLWVTRYVAARGIPQGAWEQAVQSLQRLGWLPYAIDWGDLEGGRRDSPAQSDSTR